MAELTDIEGIGEVHSEQLAKAGIGSTASLLERGATKKGRREIADLSGATQDQILAWVNRADLFRIKGIGEEYSDLLECCGVDTVPDLAQRNAGNLCSTMVTVNEQRKLVRRLPVESEIARWIDQAKKLPRVVLY